MSYKIIQHGYQIHEALHHCIVSQILPNTGVQESQFFDALVETLQQLQPQNEALLRQRDSLQAQIDSYHLTHALPANSAPNGVEEKKSREAYSAFLRQIGYIAPSGGSQTFTVSTKNIDEEIKSIPGPQLVVPIDNARYALNAVNARWGSLMDVFYGTDAGPSEADGCGKVGPNGEAYNAKRGQHVIAACFEFLDAHFPLESLEKSSKKGANASWANVSDVRVEERGKKPLAVRLTDGSAAGLRQRNQFVGFLLNHQQQISQKNQQKESDANAKLTNLLLLHNHLHVEIVFDRNSVVGRDNSAGIHDILLESAITAIADCEDSVAAVDTPDKVRVYNNWAGLMKGTLTEKLTKGNKEIVRTLRPDRSFFPAKLSGQSGPVMYTVPGRVCLLVRNVGIHMFSDMVLTPVAEGSRQTPEGIIDAFVTALGAMHDLAPQHVTNKPRNLINSQKGSMYIVKPKLHGPEEVRFTVDLFTRVERALKLAPSTLKVGVMDEERRTTVNLRECIREARDRIIFINTGFLDRTGDEIHTSFLAGPVLPKEAIKKAVWRGAYEDWNVDIGIETGVAQIGKGMWAAPDAMKDMMKQKGEHPQSGANTAWVPSPSAATLHAIHYHETDVLSVREKLKKRGSRAKLESLLVPPIMSLAERKALTQEQITFELENNVQGILGYVVRWIELGIGCSKVPDLKDVGLMEDRATLRISSQHIANWLYHGLTTKEQVLQVMEKMARVVDKPNSGSKGYEPMSGRVHESLSFQCAVELCFNGLQSANGLTEDILTKYRIAEKQRSQNQPSQMQCKL